MGSLLHALQLLLHIHLLLAGASYKTVCTAKYAQLQHGLTTATSSSKTLAPLQACPVQVMHVVDLAVHHCRAATAAFQWKHCSPYRIRDVRQTATLLAPDPVCRSHVRQHTKRLQQDVLLHQGAGTALNSTADCLYCIYWGIATGPNGKTSTRLKLGQHRVTGWPKLVQPDSTTCLVAPGQAVLCCVSDAVQHRCCATARHDCMQQHRQGGSSPPDLSSEQYEFQSQPATCSHSPYLYRSITAQNTTNTAKLTHT
jgi:hypothetical protein